jgi:hypothetical protein
MLDKFQEDAANGDFNNMRGFRVTGVPGVTGVACRLASAVSTSVKKTIVLLMGAVDVFGVAVAVLAALVKAHNRLSATYTARVQLAHAKCVSKMLAKKQSKTKMTRRMSMSENMRVSTLSQKVDSTLVLLSAIYINRSSRSSHTGRPCAMASFDLSYRPMTDITLLRSASIGVMH